MAITPSLCHSHGCWCWHWHIVLIISVNEHNSFLHKIDKIYHLFLLLSSSTACCTIYNSILKLYIHNYHRKLNRTESKERKREGNTQAHSGTPHLPHLPIHPAYAGVCAWE